GAPPAQLAPARPPRRRITALRGVHDVRNGLPGALHLHRRRRASEPRDRKGAVPLRHRPRQVRVLRLLCRGVSRRRHPDGHRHPRVLVLQPGRNDLFEGSVAGAGAGGARWTADFAGADPGRPPPMMARVAFLVIAGIAVAAALGLVLRRNAIHGALFLVMNLGCVAALYLMLGAEFLAAAQIIVYAGAIMVLFVFAIMVLIPGKEETGPDPRRVYRLLALPAGALLFLQLLFAVGGGRGPAETAPPTAGGGVEAIARLLFTQY